MHRTTLAFAAVVAATLLTGCATSPDQFNTSVNNTVQDVNTAATGAVSIVTDVVKALLAITQPVESVVTTVTGISFSK